MQDGHGRAPGWGKGLARGRCGGGGPVGPRAQLDRLSRAFRAECQQHPAASCALHIPTRVERPELDFLWHVFRCIARLRVQARMPAPSPSAMWYTVLVDAKAHPCRGQHWLRAVPHPCRQAWTSAVPTFAATSSLWSSRPPGWLRTLTSAGHGYGGLGVPRKREETV